MPRDTPIHVECHVRQIRLGPVVVLIVRARPWWAWWTRAREAPLRVRRLARQIREHITRGPG